MTLIGMLMAKRVLMVNVCVCVRLTATCVDNDKCGDDGDGHSDDGGDGDVGGDVVGGGGGDGG